MPTALPVLLLALLVPEPPFAAGRRAVDAYFQLQVKQIAAGTLAGPVTKAEWETRRPELRRQFLDMMGLWPLPPRTNLHATVTGVTDAGTHTIEKLHFQSRPGLYVTANVYVPKSPAGRKPAVLYVCGHGTVIENDIAYGSKAYYQSHPAWFAANGYVCLVLDTLQLGEIVGHHHGTYRMNLWWWQARGYTPGGVELWNAVRGLDYLETRADVDTSRVGVTGRSGGGATTWWVAAADDRPKAFAPVAGIADLRSQICEGEIPRLKSGVIAGHCDCMFPVNTYRWDFPLVAALAAPRPVLLGNSDADDIFPVAGYRRIAEKVRPVYAAYAADDKFQLLETRGPHEDTPELRRGINRWMNRWLKGNPDLPAADDLPPKRPVRELRVFARPPEDAVNETVHETFTPAAKLDLPESPAVAAAWWAGRRPGLLAELRDKLFAGFPDSPPAVTPAGDITIDGVRVRAVDFASEPGVTLRVFVATAAAGPPPTRVILSVLDDPAWATWCRDLGPGFAKVLNPPAPGFDAAKFAQNRAAMLANRWAFAAVAPRGIGPTAWAAAGSTDDTQIRRRFPLIGQTLDGRRAWDVRRAVAAAAGFDGLKGVPLTLHGEGEPAGIALVAGLLEPGVAGFDLWRLPETYKSGPTFLNLAKVCDVPQLVALAAPRPVTLHVPDPAAWAWPRKLHAGGPAWLSVLPAD